MTNETKAEARVGSNALLDDREVRAVIDSMLTVRTQRQLAEELGLSASYLNDYLHFRREPGAKLLEGLGLERVTLYRQLPSNASVKRATVES